MNTAKWEVSPPIWNEKTIVVLILDIRYEIEKFDEFEIAVLVINAVKKNWVLGRTVDFVKTILNLNKLSELANNVNY